MGRLVATAALAGACAAHGCEPRASEGAAVAGTAATGGGPRAEGDLPAPPREGEGFTKAPAAVVPGIPPPPPPLSADAPTVALPVPGRAAAVVAAPIGATERKPVLVATHGRDDVPEQLCDTWRGIIGSRGFVLCPRGVPSRSRSGAFTYTSPEALGDEIDDALSALRARWPDHVDEGPVVYSGFSLGSFQGVRVVTRAPERTPRVILIEGGHDPWTDDLIETFADGGGQRVLFVTGQAVNAQRAKLVARELSEAGIATRVVHAEDAGHVYTGEVRDNLASSFDWVVEGDDRWSR